MVSLTVADAVNQNEWHLPTFDPKNENKYHYKLQSLDIYFWTQQDALQFINGVRRVLPPAQVEVLDEPGPPPMATVVQKLENAAISDPTYGNVDKSAQASASGSAGSSLPPPPPPPPAAAPPAANFAPMAYNPAAPAAPEAFQHREKTPPPDEDPLNPLAVAVAHDYGGQPFTPGLPPPQFPLSPGFAPQTLAAARMPGGIPPGQGFNRGSSMSLPGGLASPSLNGSFQAQAAAPSSFAPPPTSASVPPPPPNPPPTQQQQQPTQAYNSYSIQGRQQAPMGAMDYSIHQQAYRPTEAESAGHKPHVYTPKDGTRGKLEENASRLEKGVTGMFKKFEKKFG